MPPLKQPAPLRAMAMDLCAETILRLCINLIEKYSDEKLRQAISTVRRSVCDYVPEYFLGELLNAVIKRSSRRRNCPDAHKHVMELLMDVDVTGLELRISTFGVDVKDVYRFRGVVELDMGSHSISESPQFFKNYQLSELRKVSVVKCSDRDLTVIGRNCSSLRSLKYTYSPITDEGLRALDQCRELRVLDISDCDQISHIGIIHLMSELAKLEDLCCGSWLVHSRPSFDGCSFLSYLERPCSSMKRFHVSTVDLTDEHLRQVVEKFPNLTSFEPTCQSLGDMSILKSLHNLERIDLFGLASYSSAQVVDRVWRSLKQLLSVIGENVKSLELPYNLSARCDSESRILIYILGACPNIEHLRCFHRSYDIVIPSTQKLRVLHLDTDQIDRDSGIVFDVEKSGTMANLEKLDLENFQVSFETIKAIMLDNVKFPKLAWLGTGGVMSEEWDEIYEIIKNNNLKFNYWCPKYLDDDESDESEDESDESEDDSE